jgi:hypothetical protein
MVGIVRRLRSDADRSQVVWIVPVAQELAVHFDQRLVKRAFGCADAVTFARAEPA